MQKNFSANLKIKSHARRPNVFKAYGLFILYAVCCTELSAGEKITCTIPSTKLNTETHLQCFFPEDLSKSTKDFTVYHYVSNGSPDAVLDCWWLSGKLDCFTRSGYDFDFVVTDSLTVHLPRVEKIQAGTYACQVAGYKPEDLNTCDLKVKPAGIASPTVQPRHPSVVNVSGRDFSPRITTNCSSTAEILGRPASVTCSAGDEKLSESFVVFHSDVNSGFRSEDFPLVCTWVEGAHVCNVLPGYVLESGITNVATLSIRNVTRAHLGSYWCRRMTALEDSEQSCEIRLHSDIYETNPSSRIAIAVIIPIIIVFAALGVLGIVKRERLEMVCRAAEESKESESVSQSNQNVDPLSSQLSVIDENCKVDEQSNSNNTAHLLEGNKQSSVEKGFSGRESRWDSNKSEIAEETESLLEYREQSSREGRSVFKHGCDEDNSVTQDDDNRLREGGFSSQDGKKQTRDCNKTNIV